MYSIYGYTILYLFVTVQNSQTVYILADHSKFGQIASVTFAQLGQTKIITDKLADKKFLTKASIKEVM